MSIGEIPSKKSSGLYSTIIADFVKSVIENPKAEANAAKVSIPNRSVKTVQIGLAKAVHMAGRTDIMVSIRNNEVWLVIK